MISVEEAAHSVGLDRIDVEETKQKLRDLAVHQIGDDTVIALEPKTILQVLGGIAAAWIGWKLARFVVPLLWKLRWVIAIAGIGAVVYSYLKRD